MRSAALIAQARLEHGVGPGGADPAHACHKSCVIIAGVSTKTPQRSKHAGISKLNDCAEPRLNFDASLFAGKPFERDDKHKFPAIHTARRNQKEPTWLELPTLSSLFFATVFGVRQQQWPLNRPKPLSSSAAARK